MAKKILIFSLAYYPHFVSGAEAAIKEITDRIDPSDIIFHMVTHLFDMSAPRNERIGNVWVHRVGFGNAYLSKILFIPLAALKARALHRTHRFSALWAMMTYMLFPTVLTRTIGVAVPHILTLQDGDPYERVFTRKCIKPFVPILDYGFRTAACIQVISTYLATWPPKRGYKGEVVLIHNGANPRDVQGECKREEIAALKRTLGKKEGDIFLVNTARLVHQKAYDVTIQALKFLPEHIKFIVVGGGDEEKKLKNLAKNLDLEKRIVFVGKVDRSVVSHYRQASDIFVGPSRSEGLGNAFLSAMASRLPVVATQDGGIADFLFDKKHNPGKEPTGWVVDKDNPTQIAEAVQDILAHPETTKVITERARAMVLRSFNWDMVAQDMRERFFGKALS